MRVPRGHISRLSSSAPTHLGLEQIWQRREPRKHLLSTGSQAEAGSTSSLSTGGILSPDPPDISADEDSDDDSDGHYEDVSSDNGDSDDDDEHGNRNSNGKRERYFWQYNVQAKGPKGQRLVLKTKLKDPHCLNEVTDPVFSPDCSVMAMILHQIQENCISLLANFHLMCDLPQEKKKIKRLINGIIQAKQNLVAKLNEQSPERQEEFTTNIEKVLKYCSKIRIAGQTTEYVNKILDKFRNGVTTVATTEDI
ncbi:hypothetical protein NQ317_014572 [Molorchus minor]|uniref:Uncharacterized protein n=1 Tax=Molorchus minor TaxID=1323400 RepID=A0ABQ9JSI5_9CUCU|nr:hypothetical protein NQ317_014572 [Molorchus minor]